MKLLAEAKKILAEGVYFTFNPVAPALLARCCNRVRTKSPARFHVLSSLSSLWSHGRERRDGDFFGFPAGGTVASAAAQAKARRDVAGGHSAVRPPGPSLRWKPWPRRR